MKAIYVLFDSLNRHLLSPYGCDWIKTPNFERLAAHSVRFDQCWVGSLPCMPARRELHTGRYNFLHRSWGPLEPFDDSMPQILKDNGVHSHLVTDHYHYFEDAGATYHTRYSSYESVRGQEGDAWKALVGFCDFPPRHRNRCGEPQDRWVEQDFVNRTFMKTAEQQSLGRTFAEGLEFIDHNHAEDRWFLQIESFDPHEPFFSQDEFRQMYPDVYEGDFCDWPEYRPVDERDSAEFIHHMRMQYAALLSQCDAQLGLLLDKMDAYNLWEDCMLMVSTDHGFLLGEHGQWAKCHCPFYPEVAHIPLFVWDPRDKRQACASQKLVQTIDLPVSLLEFFGQTPPPDMQGRALSQSADEAAGARTALIFGIFGGQIGCTDGLWVYLRSPQRSDTEIYEYTLMPMRHGGRRAFFENNVLRGAELVGPFPFTKDLPLLRLKYDKQNSQAAYPSQLFRLSADAAWEKAANDPVQEKRLSGLMRELMIANDCPPEQLLRMGL